MRVNADFTQTVIITPAKYTWTPSPMPGVERMMLDRIGDEVARATSIVRYAPDSSFPTHIHGGGEEIFVLGGIFADEHGNYGKGYYLRNPIGTSHAPKVGPKGATIFVKLHQFSAEDTVQKKIDTTSEKWQSSHHGAITILPLHEFGAETVKLIKCAADTDIPTEELANGAEILVVEGGISDKDSHYQQGAWLRYPYGSLPILKSETGGTLLFVKTGHLPAP